jgi:hypothetical protein
MGVRLIKAHPRVEKSEAPACHGVVSLGFFNVSSLLQEKAALRRSFCALSISVNLWLNTENHPIFGE